MSCPISAEMVNAYVDDLLSASERDQVHAHMVDCDACRSLALRLQDEAEGLRSALVGGDLAFDMYVGPRSHPWQTAWRFAAAVALVLATSLTTIWLDRLTKPQDDQGYLIRSATFKLGANARAPKVIVRVSRDDSRWRVEPASFVVNRDGQSGAAAEEIEL